jgi:predicted MPP superfamily phosphohydrolase
MELIVHLSDIHFREPMGQNHILSRAAKIAAAATSTIPSVGSCFVVVSGDIAFSGKTTEYEIAARFLGELRDHIQRRLSDCVCRFVLVPGNHDCDFSETGSLRDIVVSKTEPEQLDESLYPIGTAVQRNYETFVAQLRTELDADIAEPPGSSGVYRAETYDLSERSIRFRLINSAWMSSKKEVQGTLLYPVNLLRSDEDVGQSADLVVTVLHHPYNWFEAKTGRSLRDEIEASSDIVLTGHEHEGDHYRKSDYAEQTVEYLEGAILQDPNHPERSSFNTVGIDLEQRKQRVQVWSWNRKDERYDSKEDTDWIELQRNLYRLREEYRLTDYFDRWLKDPGVRFTHPEVEEISLEDLFVYPDLRQSNLPGDDEPSSAFVRGEVPVFILQHQHILVVGPERCGKTSLAKTIFQDFRGRDLVPVLISGEELRSYSESSVMSTVQRKFEEQYASPGLEAFRQLESEEKVIIVDDIDRAPVNLRGRDKIIDTLKGICGVVVLLGDERLRLDDMITPEAEKLAMWSFTQCEILPFGHLRRADLIEKWYFLGRRYTHESSELSRLAIQAERVVSLLLGQDFIPSHPIFILMILQQMEAGVPLNTAGTSGSYGYLYEALLTEALAHASGLEPDLDTQYAYLSGFAYALFSQQTDSLSTDEASDWHQRHCERHSLRLDFSRFLSAFCEAGVLCETEGRISFRYPYIYYYFVARYFRDRIQDDSIRDHIGELSMRLHHRKSANILLFLSYLSRDPYILSAVLRASRRLFSGYPDCDLDEDAKLFVDLASDIPELVLDASRPEDRRRKLLAERDDLERTQPGQESSESLGDSAVDLDEDLTEVGQINTAFKTIQILGQILRNFAGSLEREQKLELARECYSLGLRMLKFVFGTLESGKEDIVMHLARFLKERYPTWPVERLADRVSRFLFNQMVWITFVIVKQVSDSVGLERLSMTFDELLGESDTISYRFIDVSVRLDYYRRFPETEVFQLDKDTRRSPFAAHLLRRLVWHYFYIYDTVRTVRESVCARLEIKLLPGSRNARAKRLRR